MTVTPQHQFNVACKGLIQLVSANNCCFSDNDDDRATIKTTTPNMQCGENQATAFLFNPSFNLEDVHYRKQGAS